MHNGNSRTVAQGIDSSICISLFFPLTSVSTASNSAFAILSKKLSLFLTAVLLCGWRNKEINDYLLILLIILLAKNLSKLYFL